MNGFLWKFLERFAAGLVTLTVSVILARMLTPDDYSVVGIVTIFFNFANVMISNGLNTALIQKKNADITDYSSVLHISVLISLVLYAALFFASAPISRLYGKPLLIPLFRVMGLQLIMNAVKAVLCAYISNRLEFKKFFLATIVGTAISAVIGIWMAGLGFGPWALIAQQMSNTAIDTVLLFFSTRFKILWEISFFRLKSLFNFGWKMLVSAMIDELYSSASPLIIGFKYTPSDLAYYTKGRLYPAYAYHIITNTISAVLFPVMSKFGDQTERLKLYVSGFLKIASYVLAPLLIGFAVVSDNFIRVVLTEKWLPASIYLKIYCVNFLLNIITIGNLEVIKAMGRSDIYLKLEIVKKTSYLVMMCLFLFLTHSPATFTLLHLVTSSIAAVLNSIPNGRLIDYSLFMQLKDIMPALLMSLAMSAPLYLVNLLPLSAFVALPLQILLGMAIYLTLSVIFKPFGFRYCMDTVKKLRKR